MGRNSPPAGVFRLVAPSVAGERRWAGPVYGYADLIEDAQIKHNGTLVEYDHPTEGHVKTPGFPIRFSKTPSKVYRGAPLAGEHTREVLKEAGLSDERIDALAAKGAIFAAPEGS